MRLRHLGAAVSLALVATGTATGTAAAQAPLAGWVAARHPLPATGVRMPRVLRSDVTASGGGSVPDPSTIDAYDSVVDGISANGVARLGIFATPTTGFSCTGALIAPTVMLTAAHCVTDDLTGALLSTDGLVRARFIGPGAQAVDRWSRKVVVRPEWQGFANPLTNGGHDVALVFLAEPAAPWMTRYDLFAGDPYEPWFANADFIGYGEHGSGSEGSQGFDRSRRWGQNRVDYVSNAAFDPSDAGILWTDFDDGDATNDAFCWATGGGAGNPFCDTGRGPTEFGLGLGDSGGPLFVDGRIAGIASFGTYFCGDAACSRAASPPLYAPQNGAGWGSLSGFASVAYNVEWIEAAIAANVRVTPVATPEPTTVVLTAGGLLAIGVARRRRAR